MVKESHFNFHSAGCLSASSYFPSQLKVGVFLGTFTSFFSSPFLILSYPLNFTFTKELQN